MMLPLPTPGNRSWFTRQLAISNGDWRLQDATELGPKPDNALHAVHGNGEPYTHTDEAASNISMEEQTTEQYT